MNILRCEICGNVGHIIDKNGPSLFCCGQKMTELNGKEKDGAGEKHVPLAIKENNKLIIKVGSVLHPVSEEHYISFLIIVNKGNKTIIDLKGKSPEIELDNTEYEEIYAYCNLHGLWKLEK